VEPSVVDIVAAHARRVVYLSADARHLADGRRALVEVPERVTDTVERLVAYRPRAFASGRTATRTTSLQG
jgi:hypothetical protein